MKSVITTRCVNVFVSRLHLETTDKELVDSMHSVIKCMLSAVRS